MKKIFLTVSVLLGINFIASAAPTLEVHKGFWGQFFGYRHVTPFTNPVTGNSRLTCTGIGGSPCKFFTIEEPSIVGNSGNGYTYTTIDNFVMSEIVKGNTSGTEILDGVTINWNSSQEDDFIDWSAKKN
jgi:hypothetical protein